MPARISTGFTTIEFALVLEQESLHAGLQTISRPVVGRSTASVREMTLSEIGGSPTVAELTKWFESLLQVQRSAAGSSAFYEETAQAVVEMIKLDRGLVLLQRDNEWEIMGRHSARDSQGPLFSRTVLSQVVDQQRTFYRGISQREREESLIGIEAVVASPIFDVEGSVIGAVYGTRYTDPASEENGIRPIEAQLVQLLAGAVSSGLARVQKEEEAARTRVQFEQFFSQKLVTELERNPSLLDGHDREITVLFCDLRKFSLISERLGTRQVYELLGEMMDQFTNVVMDFGGVIVDYHGDGLAAMWNAPTDDQMHAQNACDAAVTMLTELEFLNAKWEPICGFPLSIGIGVNSGNARVGNAGSRRRMKYGPLGHTVNLASRLEGVTKTFSIPILITESTQQQLADKQRTRRLCRVLAFGMESPVSIYEYALCATADDRWAKLKADYEKAFSHFENWEITEAKSIVEQLLSSPIASNDGPTQFLWERISSAEDGDSGAFDPVYHMTTK
jgi:adenylate cyclase